MVKIKAVKHWLTIFKTKFQQKYNIDNYVFFYLNEKYAKINVLEVG
jgi:hypothetical protein